jgi:hypothetical protein
VEAIMRKARALLAVSFGSLGLLGTGCAHVSESQAAAPERQDRVFVTGSRIPQRVDPETGQAASASSLTVYSRADLDRAGMSGNLGAALRSLNPALQGTGGK